MRAYGSGFSRPLLSRLVRRALLSKATHVTFVHRFEKSATAPGPQDTQPSVPWQAFAAAPAPPRPPLAAPPVVPPAPACAGVPMASTEATQIPNVRLHDEPGYRAQSRLL